MTETLSNASAKLIIKGTLTTDATDLASSTSIIDITKTLQITHANNVWSDQRTLTASATENLDLAGVLTNAFGTVLTFTEIQAMYIFASAANTNNVVVGGHATAAFINWVGDATDTVTVLPGNFLMLTGDTAAGFAVTATTGDMLTITNSSGGTSVTYDIVIFGTV